MKEPDLCWVLAVDVGLVLLLVLIGSLPSLRRLRRLGRRLVGRLGRFFAGIVVGIGRFIWDTRGWILLGLLATLARRLG